MPASPPAPTPEKPAAAPAQPVATGIDWGWPANGKLLANFSDSNAGAQGLNRGVDIAGNVGEPVLAAAPGKVIFVGVYPKHGNLVVLLHAEGYSSVYAHNSRVLVKEGQMVKRGQRIADLGNSDADQPKLHFEVRQQGKPVDPLKFLPPR
jgi:lipoprotein NlpD